MDKLIELGSCRKAHGIKGAFTFTLINQKDSSLKKGSKIILRPLSPQSSIDGDGVEYEISTIGFGNKTIVTLKGVDNRNLVEEMIPFIIYIKRSELPEVEEDNFYLSDLIGLNAISDDGAKVGVITEIGSNGVQDILIIDNGETIVEILLVDHFVKEVNWDEGSVTVILPELV